MISADRNLKAIGGIQMAQSIFLRYGGFASVSKVVSAFYDKAIESPLLSPYFENIDMPRLIDHQTKFFSSLMGGPASFSNARLTCLRQASSDFPASSPICLKLDF